MKSCKFQIRDRVVYINSSCNLTKIVGTIINIRKESYLAKNYTIQWDRNGNSVNYVSECDLAIFLNGIDKLKEIL